MTNKTQITELRDALIAALEWIDAVPSDTELPTMPGFDRDYVDSLIAGLKPAAPVIDAVPDLFLLPVMRDGEKLYSECGKDYPRGRGYFTHAQPVPVVVLPSDTPVLINLSLEQQNEFNTGFWFGIEKVKRLNPATSFKPADGEEK